MRKHHLVGEDAAIRQLLKPFSCLLRRQMNIYLGIQSEEMFREMDVTQSQSKTENRRP